jgi:integrase
MKAWDSLHPPSSHAPLPFRWASLVAVGLASLGELRAGVAVLTSFAAFLRVGELLRLTASDVLLPEDSRSSGGSCGMRIGVAKGGRNQYAPITDAAVVTYLRALVSTLSPAQRLFPFTATQFNDLLRRACVAVSLPPIFTAHSLRHGAASHAALCGAPPETIRRLGRWRSSQSMETYLQEVQSRLLLQQVPSAVAGYLSRMDDWRRDLLRFVPAEGPAGRTDCL